LSFQAGEVSVQTIEINCIGQIETLQKSDSQPAGLTSQDR